MIKGKAPSVQRTETTTSDLLRTKLIPNLIALKTILDQRRPDASTVERLGRMLQLPSRAIKVYPRLNKRPVQAINKPRVGIYAGLKVISDQKQTKGYRTVCQRRSERRESLFAMGIAGPGRRRSPGQGGSYKRSEGSQIICKTVRR